MERQVHIQDNKLRHEIVRRLNRLIALDYDAAIAYQAAIDRLEDEDCKTKLSELKIDHERHTRTLGDLVETLGGEPRQRGDLKQVLTQGKVVLGGLTSDESILRAMRSNEEQTNQQVADLLEHPSLPPAIREVLEKHLGDERRHRQWIVTRMAQFVD